MSETTGPVCPLGWEAGHSDRRTWSDDLYNLVAGELFFSFDGAQDAPRIRSDYYQLSHGGRATVWCEFICWIAKFESGWSPVSRMKEGSMGIDPVSGQPVYSEGLLQLSYQDTLNYPWLKSGIDWSKDKYLTPDDPNKTILNPIINLEAGARILAQQISKRGKAILSTGVYWAVIHDGGKYDKSAEIIAKVARLRLPRIHTETPAPTPWLDRLRTYIGEPCPTGQPPTPWITKTFTFTNFGPLHGVTPPACAATVCRVLEETGYRSTHEADAISYMSYGDACGLEKGAILVFEWNDGSHHVTLCDAVFEKMVRCLGGNQDHLVKDSDYQIANIIAMRWPVRKLSR